MDTASMQAAKNYAVAGATTLPAQPALSALYEALKRISDASGMARNAADQLCGSYPESVGKEPQERSSSYFGQLDDIAASMGVQADRIVGDIQRILNRL